MCTSMGPPVYWSTGSLSEPKSLNTTYAPLVSINCQQCFRWVGLYEFSIHCGILAVFGFGLSVLHMFYQPPFVHMYNFITMSDKFCFTKNVSHSVSYNLLLLFCDIWALWGRWVRLVYHLEMNTPQSLSFSACWPIVGLCTNKHLPWRAFLMRVERCTNL